MQLRKLLVAGAAVAAAATMSLAPAVQADDPGGPIASVAVDGDTTTADYDASLTAKLPLTVSMKVYGSWQNLTCSAGSASGEVHAGSPAPSPFMNFDSLNLTCNSFIPGSTVSISIPSNGCASLVMDDDVHDGLVNTGLDKDGKYSVVEGRLQFSGSCVVTVVADICTVELGGGIDVKFDEAVKTDGSQNLYLWGDDDLEVLDASFGCLGAVTEGDYLDLGENETPGVTFNLLLDDGAGPIDFRESA